MSKQRTPKPLFSILSVILVIYCTNMAEQTKAIITVVSVGLAISYSLHLLRVGLDVLSIICDMKPPAQHPVIRVCTFLVGVAGALWAASMGFKILLALGILSIIGAGVNWRAVYEDTCE